MPDLPYTELIAVVVVMIYITAIFSAIEAVMTVRTAQGAIAWTISLLTLPYVALPLYLIFGRNRFDGYIEQRGEIEAQTEALSEETLEAVARHTRHGDPAFPIYGSLARLARLPATGGNDVELLINGQATFASIMQGLESAENYILVQFYIIRDDNLGARIGEVLSRKARAGVRVFLLYDEIGCPRFRRTAMYQRMQRAGVQSAAFNTTQGRRNRLQLNFRNHRKIVVVDGRMAWVGGHNIGDEYLGLGRRGAWRDTHLRLRGPAVMSTELAFATDWRWATRQPVDVNWEFHDGRAGDCNVLIFPSDPASEFEEAGLMYHEVIISARQRIWIASPYFVPDRGIVSALQLAALRGVDVRVMIPDRPDGPVVGMANWAFTRELLPAGVNVYRYREGFMHQKVFLMDDRLAGVGTANFDNRSFRLNFEITALVENADFCAGVEAMLKADFEQSDRVVAQDFRDKPFWFPFAMGAARLLSPVL
ncbi:cardiolipin synthase [Chromatocurvus halotolerans]|uniref:Cardiolipin synthase n=1 Tax=Chromatocurvus halotolerans TaxID=1132028 RepID=A0A4R2KTJ2_9GAMM|nr:cardiolipin synthase [Chromatocurvus halotolerans]TCO76152.1 cardiolipin synthase [Chromatocurvus halotolerans]